MNPFVSTLILLAGLTGTSSGVANQPSDHQVSTSRTTTLTVQPKSAPPQVSTRAVITSGDGFYSEPFLPGQTRENVLVVPTPDLPAERMADLAEDLTVMCRIFDKSLPSIRTSIGFAYAYSGLGYALAGQTSTTQGLYLDGYGALFFIHVDYPLMPPEPQEPSSPAKEQDSTDPVWSQTIREMTGQPGEEPKTRRTAPTYDPQKVENLKETLIKTLTHTSNIRMRRPQDVITLVIGALDDNQAPAYGRSGRMRLGTSPTPAQAGIGSSAALLVLRVTKADVDAFAKGQLTPAQFTEKVQVLWSPAGLSASPDEKTPRSSTALPRR